MVDIESNILQNLNKGKESALKEVYRLFFHALCAFGTRFVKDDAVVADIVQEVFIKVWARRTDFQAIYSLRSFMYLSVRNACLNYNHDPVFPRAHGDVPPLVAAAFGREYFPARHRLDPAPVVAQNARENRVEGSHADIAAAVVGDHLCDAFAPLLGGLVGRSEEHTSELQSH